ncbi:hypothetical protein JD844_001516 [Phrynosoma platyrhinos]|uniref:CWH43-like N-terminal domain-containing protein n=1 Tax=Phrynosoma platyrhinos TaxID=52577 RepID=A0ABQ7TA13_PHRPL|nr:hypothetical protein JD844_001516 [Phrynosoma platyrhinos]
MPLDPGIVAPKAFLDVLPIFFTLFRSPATMWVWALLPVLLAAGGIVGFWVVFAMAVANGSVNITEAFPYISTCGAHPPQSCLFGQVLNLGAFLVISWIKIYMMSLPGVVICFLKFQQVRDYGCHSRLNIIGLVLGLLCALGASIVGNFQQYNQLETHLFGAFLAFVVGILYFWIQTFLTNQVKPRHGGPWIASLRFSLSFCGSAFLIASILNMTAREMGKVEGKKQVRTVGQDLVLSVALEDRVQAVALFYLKLDSEAAYCEWALAMDLFLLFGLFAVDFWHIGTCSVHVHHQRADRETPDTQVSTQTLAL